MKTDEPTYKDFVKQVRGIQKWADNLSSIEEEHWEGLTEEQRENFYRQVTSEHTWIKALAERYFDW